MVPKRKNVTKNKTDLDVKTRGESNGTNYSSLRWFVQELWDKIWRWVQLSTYIICKISSKIDKKPRDFKTDEIWFPDGQTIGNNHKSLYTDGLAICT